MLVDEIAKQEGMPRRAIPQQAGASPPVMWWALACPLMLGLCIHFSMILCVLLPSSPLQVVFIRAATRYVYPYFGQNWNFFAPTPVDKTESLVAHARYMSSVTGKVEETSWVDVNEPLIEQLRRSRTSPLAIVQLGLSNAVINYGNSLSQDPKAYTLDKDGKTKILRSPIPADVNPKTLNLLTRGALSSLAIQYPEKKFTEVQVGIKSHIFPRFLQRSEPDSAKNDTLLMTPWQPAFEVPKFCCQATAH